MNKKILKLSPIFKGKPWGYEKWILCCREDGESIIKNQDIPNKSLWDYLDYRLFPLLIKIIRAEENLSIQVHPDNLYAKEIENDLGKNEFWYILDAKKDAYIYCGLNKDMEKEELSQILKEGSIEKYLNKIYVNTNDSIYIPSGVIHAIGRNVTLLELQKNSNITYRIYDYNRGRELHLDKALDVINIRKNRCVKKKENFSFFKNQDFFMKKSTLNLYASYYNRDNFELIYVCSGDGIIFNENQSEKENIKAGDLVYIEKNTLYNLAGIMEYMYIRAK